MSGDVVLVCVVVALVAVGAPLLRWRMRRDVARARFQALLEQMRRDLETTAAVIGAALIPSMRALAQAMTRWAAAAPLASTPPEDRE